MPESPHQRLLTLLNASGVEYTLSEHEPVYTSAEAARVRGTELKTGAKALVLKSDHGFLLAVIPADLELDGPALRKHIHSRRLRFANKDELLELTGLTPGAVPPFGSLFNLSTVCDVRLGENKLINFNAASHARSVQLQCVDYKRIENPEVADITRHEPKPVK